MQRTLQRFLLLSFLLFVPAKAVELLQPFPANIFEITGASVDVTCIFRDQEGPPVRAKFMRGEPYPGIRWFDINETARVYQTNITQGNTVTVTLHFKSLEIKDDAESGRYECTAISAKGVELSHGFNLKVTPREDLPVVRVISSQTASIGDDVRLYCNRTHKGNSDTTPITLMTFLKDGHPVKKTSDVEDPLILTDVRAEDGGNYSCRVLVKLKRLIPYNVTGTETAYLRVRVSFPFEKSRIVVSVGDTARLVCSAQGYPMTIQWKKLDKEGENGIVIKPNDRFTIKGQCDYCRSVLEITDLSTKDSGNYSCSAVEDPGRQVFMVEVKTNVTSVAVTTVRPYYITPVISVSLWIWWLN